MPVLRSQLEQGAPEKDLIGEGLCPIFPKLGMVDPGPGAEGGGWKGIDGEDQEMSLQSLRGCSVIRRRQEPA